VSDISFYYNTDQEMFACILFGRSQTSWRSQKSRHILRTAQKTKKMTSMATCPQAAARCRADLPKLSCIEISAPLCSKASTHSS
jgi:hypothetical protein